MAYNLLKGKKGVIFGALDENSIAWKVAERCYEEGAQIVLTNTRLAIRKGDLDSLAKKIQSEIIPADVTDLTDLEGLFSESINILGGKVDFILHSVGMSPNVRKGIHYTDLNYDFFHKTLDVSAISLHKVLQTCMKLDAINDWGSVIALSYIAAQRTYSTYSDMAQAKAMLESIARSFGYHYGLKKKVRINTVSQSPTRTTAGSGVGGFDSFYSLANCMSPLGNATSDDCADFCALLFSDYTRKITMQNIFHDGGYSSMGISERLVGKCFTCANECDGNMNQNNLTETE